MGVEGRGPRGGDASIRYYIGPARKIYVFLVVSSGVVHSSVGILSWSGHECAVRHTKTGDCSWEHNPTFPVFFRRKNLQKAQGRFSGTYVRCVMESLFLIE